MGTPIYKVVQMIKGIKSRLKKNKSGGFFLIFKVLT